MALKIAEFAKQKIVVLFLCGLLLCIFSGINFSWNNAVKDITCDLQFKIRGDRPLSDQIVFVYLGAEDIRALGGWPITRDYYGYMIYVLQKMGAKVVALDILFEKPAQPYREYDEMLGNLFLLAGNVCLPMTFSEISADGKDSKHGGGDFPLGKNPVFPLPPLRENSAGIGFSNLGEAGVIRKVPLVASNGDSLIPSFGLEMARLYIGSKEVPEASLEGLRLADSTGKVFFTLLDARGRLRLNHFGGMEKARSIGFVDLLKTVDENPDSLNLTGKLILVAATAPGLPVLRATPFSEVFPASLLHATIAENIILRNYLQDVPGYANWLIILGMILLVALTWQIRNRNWLILAGIGVWLVYFAITAFLFAASNLILPLFYPTLAYLAAQGYLLFSEQGKQRREELSHRNLLKEQIDKKEKELKTAQSTLETLQSELSDTEAGSAQYRQLAEERQKAILQLENELRDLQGYILPEKAHSPEEFPGIIHAPESKLTEVLELVSRIRSDDIPVLIEGDTGTGKEMIARAIHRTSRRKDKPFVAVNCGALPETLLESELFGHEKGSFTGAQSQRRGRFEIANGGTIFLDEITETSPAFQSKLLRVLQEGTFERVGGEKTLKVDVRVIAACNRNLQSEMEKGNFRPDLFYRLNGFPLKLPSLHERVEDIPLLTGHFLEKHAPSTAMRLSDQAVDILQNYHWPGNVRELENAIRRAVILARSENRDIVRSSDLPPEVAQQSAPQISAEMYKPLEEQILEALRSFKFSRSAIVETAKALGNRDRGTITEYLRGFCFEELVKAGYDIEKAAKSVSGTSEEKVIEKVRKKMEDYLSNLYPLPEISSAAEEVDTASFSQFKGLPKKYHPYLLDIIAHFREKQ